MKKSNNSKNRKTVGGNILQEDLVSRNWDMAFGKMTLGWMIMFIIYYGVYVLLTKIRLSPTTGILKLGN